MKKILSMTLLLSLTAALIGGCDAQTPAKSTTSQTAAVQTVAQTTAAEQAAVAETSKKCDDAGESAGEKAAALRVMALKGPTAMGMVKMLDDADQDILTDYDYEFTIAAAADEVTPKLVQGQADIAAVPANLASILYNNTDGKIRVLAINTLGVLYDVENGETIQAVEYLRGKTIYASGKGATPEYALNYILSGNGIDPEKDVTIE